jgi:threonine efflux protein
MHEVSILTTLAGIHVIALVSPGPDVALVIQNSTRYGRQTGVYIALGLSVGIFFHALLSLTGVSYLVYQQPTLFAVLQLLGGSYLLYLGGRTLHSTKRNWRQEEGDVTSTSEYLLDNKRQAFSRGFMTNILNPKALVFFVSLMSTIVPPNMSLLGKSSALIMLWGLSFVWFAALAWMLSTKRFQLKLQTASRYIDLSCGIIFTIIGGVIFWRFFNS